MLKIKYVSQYNQPEHVKAAIADLLPEVDFRTRFVLKEQEDPTFNPNTEDDALRLIKLDAKSGKTTELRTDGEAEYGRPFNFGDGTSQKVTVRNWNYVLLTNEIREADNQYSVVKTCYIKDREVFAGLRVAVGLAAF